MFEGISGGRVSSEVLKSGARPLAAREHDLLDAGPVLTGHERWCLLRTAAGPSAAARAHGAGRAVHRTGIAVAKTTAILLADRSGEAARIALGIDRSGALLGAPTRVPLGRALQGLGVTRDPLDVRLTPGVYDAAGEAQIILSEALLLNRAGRPIAFVTERVYQRFLDAFPGPWPDVPQPGSSAAMAVLVAGPSRAG